MYCVRLSLEAPTTSLKMRTLLLATLILVLAATASAQDSGTPIELGQSVKRTLLPGERHRFALDAPAKSRYTGYVDQLTTDVVVEVYSPTGDQIASFDDPARGPEAFNVVAMVPGIYSIEVIPFNEDEPGEYVMAVDGVEEIAPLGPDGTASTVLSAGGGILFEVELARSQVLRGRVDQTNVDVVVQTLTTSGDYLGEFDRRRSGQEAFVLQPDTTGIFLVRVGTAVDGLSGTISISAEVEERDPRFIESSGIGDFTPTENQKTNLALLGRVWGFLKYHHPAVTTGQHDWDFELFRILPAAIAAETKEQAQEAILQWSIALGEAPPCDPCAQTPDDLHLSAPTGWLQDTEFLGRELSTFLLSTRRNRHAQGDQFYVAHWPIGVPYFDNEDGYPDILEPDAGYRLLGLFRYWNFIEYWFPYRDLVHGDWTEVLDEFIPRFVGATSGDDYGREVTLLAARVRDGHVNVWGTSFERYFPGGGPCQLPFWHRPVGDAVVVHDVIRSDGIEMGDVLTSVDGTPIKEFFDGLAPYFSASNDATLKLSMARHLLRGECGPTTVSVDRSGRQLTLEIDRVDMENEERLRGRLMDRPGDTFQLLSEDVAYLKLSSVKRSDAAAYVNRADGTKGLVIDIRNYPSEFMVWALGPHLVADTTEFARFTGGSSSDPGAFSFTESLALAPSEPHYQGQVLILVNEDSISQSEYTAMAFRASPESVVVGSTTAGADGNVNRLPLPGGIVTTFSGIGVFYPDKTPTQRVGIIPDVYVEPTVEGIRAGRDEVLEAAIRVILGDEISDDTIIDMARRR